MEAVSLKYPEVKNYIGGEFKGSDNRNMDVYSPLTGEKISTVVLSSASDLDDAVNAAKKAFPAWSNMTIKERVQIFFKYRQLLH